MIRNFNISITAHTNYYVMPSSSNNPLSTPIAAFSTALYEVEKYGVFFIVLNVHSMLKTAPGFGVRIRNAKC